MEMLIGRWSDQEAYRGTAGEVLPQHLGPVNKRDIPCEGCSLKSYCAAQGTDCAAFRAWTDTGNYKDEYSDLALRDMDGRKVLISQEILQLVLGQ